MILPKVYHSLQEITNFFARDFLRWAMFLQSNKNATESSKILLLADGNFAILTLMLGLGLWQVKHRLYGGKGEEKDERSGNIAAFRKCWKQEAYGKALRRGNTENSASEYFAFATASAVTRRILPISFPPYEKVTLPAGAPAKTGAISPSSYV